MNVALVVSILILAVGIGICIAVGRRRPIGTPVTWGEAFVAATFVFALMLVAYGVIPHQWLEYSDSELLWRSDKLLLAISSDGITWGQEAKTAGGTGRIIINYQAIRDIVAATFYIVFLGLQIVLWSKWQTRGRVTETAEAAGEVRSRFGRPVLKKA
ncbi:MAG: hypothetical protein ACR2HV_03370 [Acidimicrobiales bacterium]